MLGTTGGAVCGGAIAVLIPHFAELLAGLTRGLDNDALHRIQDGIGTAMASLHATGLEAERERATHLSSGPDSGPLLRTIQRLRHDVVMIGRACVVPLPGAAAVRCQQRDRRLYARGGYVLAERQRRRGHSQRSAARCRACSSRGALSGDRWIAAWHQQQLTVIVAGRAVKELCEIHGVSEIRVASRLSRTSRETGS